MLEIGKLETFCANRYLSCRRMYSITDNIFILLFYFKVNPISEQKGKLDISVCD